MALLVAGIILFIATHLVRPFAPGLRAGSIATLGKPAFMAIHGIVSLLSLVMMAYGFVQARETGGTMLYQPPTFMTHITLTLMVISAICLVAAFLPAGYIRTKLKFPAVAAIKAWAFAHLLANGESYSVLLFGAILAWAIVLQISLKKRVTTGEATLPVFVSVRYDLIAAVLGLALYGLIVLKLHEWIIGVAPLVL
ncbi:NnrU family protein [Rhizobium sp. ARZ01]|uniref:NnrU family protein n=1 Tax=Rhizobium sp. ARZ01 TaxID=2769313 RepID=UPI001782E9ED|nr:NnrU family protein [Rhizobium sp. ARZ01]MBD9373144.1 NnrU family protein [Rhizobium sp. ARZ01]